MSEVTLREWTCETIPRAQFGPAAWEALERVPRGALRVRETRAGIELHARAHIGRVQLGRLRVTVLPKLAADPLQRLFAYTYGLGDLGLVDPTTYSGGEMLQELLAQQLYRHATAILDRGLDRRYRRIHAQLPNPRGRLDVPELARRMPLIQPALPCIDRQRVVDHELHRALLAGLLFAASHVSHSELRARLRHLSARLGEEIPRVPLTRDLIRAAFRSLHRQVEHYRPALQLIELLHSGGGFELGGTGRENSAPGFLFNMNSFFQALVLKFLQEHLRDCEVRSEQTLRRLYRWSVPHHPGRKPPRPRPDFAVHKHGRVALLDAKYRDLSVTKLPREMLYQLTVYAASQGPGGEAAIIYPTQRQPNYAQERLDLFDVSAHSPSASIYLRPLPLDDLADALAAGERGHTGRIALARRLAFGPSQ